MSIPCVNDEYLGPIHGYFQLPGEFWDKSNFENQNYATLKENYDNGIPGLTVFSYILKDCATLGYTAEIVAVNPSSSYVPPEADLNSGKRLIAMSKKDSNLSFFVQNTNGNTWTYKNTNMPASNSCFVHTNVVLTNQNIREHINCNEHDDYTLFFYVDAPGTPDISHANGQNSNSLKTSLTNYDHAGSRAISSQILPNISAINKTGLIDYVGDIDFYIFNVTTSDTYSFEFLKANTYPISVDFAEVTNVSSGLLNFSTYSSSATSTRLSFTQPLITGKRYVVRIRSTTIDTIYNNNRYYSMTIQ